MIAELQTGTISPEMADKLASLFTTEHETNDSQMKAAQSLLAQLTQVRTHSDAATLPDSQAVETAFSGAVTTVTNELETVCAREAKTVDTAVGNALQERDADAANAVRQSLKLSGS